MGVRIGFIGTGGIAGMHLGLLPDIERAELVAYADIQIERAQAAADRCGGRAYGDYREMLDRGRTGCRVRVPPALRPRRSRNGGA